MLPVFFRRKDEENPENRNVKGKFSFDRRYSILYTDYALPRTG